MLATYGIAFIAGLLSFFSPCVLPVMPGYLCFMMSCAPRGSRNKEQLVQEKDSSSPTFKEDKSVFLSLMVACAFTLGFASVFVILGAIASDLHAFFLHYKFWFLRFGALLVIIFGFLTLEWIRFPFLERDKRWQPTERFFKGKNALWLIGGAYVVGGTFGFGWTPCIGPMLGSILVLSAQTESLKHGIFLLMLYSFGLGLPFIAMAIFFQAFMRYMPFLTRFMPFVRKVSGGMLIAIGLYILWASSLPAFSLS